MSEAEWLTRKKRIDARLKKQGWKLQKFSSGLDLTSLDCVAVEEFPTANGPADYALFVGGRVLGIIEAKKVTVNPQNVLEQAKRYAAALPMRPGNWNGYRSLSLRDQRRNHLAPGRARREEARLPATAHFHTPRLRSKPDVRLRYQAAHDGCSTRRRTSITRLRPLPASDCNRRRPRPPSVRGRRELLVAMATGTGKTFLTVAQVYRLLESKLARRILFLVDRKALAAQAVREFNAFNTPKDNKFAQEYEVYSQRFQKEDFGDDDPFDPKVLPNEYLTAPKPSHTFVYVSTIQRMARNLFGAEGCFAQSGGDPDLEDDADKLDIPIHAFDLIIADECHRGYTAQEMSIWRDTINHFDAIKIGLTATPAAHTTALFGAPVFRYTVEQAILDGYLVDYEPVAIKSEVRMNGVFLKEGETVERVDTDTGAEGARPTGRRTRLRRRRGRARHHRAGQQPQDHRGSRQIRLRTRGRRPAAFPKILIFAVNDLPHTSHADQLVQICREVFDQGDDFVQKITGNPNVDRPLQRIREFRNRPNPKVVVTVDMLSTGVDIPALEFIVFLRPVKSRILWEQMLGRGTRLCDDINKTKFVVFDCFDGTLIQYFKDVSSFEIERPGRTRSRIPEIIENIWQNVDRDYHVHVLVKRLLRIDKDMSGEAREQFAAWIPDGDMGRFAGELPQRLRDDFADTMKLLRNPDVPDICSWTTRAPNAPFWVGYEVEGRGHSDDGAVRQVRDSRRITSPPSRSSSRRTSTRVAAIEILLNRPQDWQPRGAGGAANALLQQRLR